MKISSLPRTAAGGKGRSCDATLGSLVRAADVAAADSLSSVVLRALEDAGAKHAVLYILDYDESFLQPTPGSVAGPDEIEPVPVEGTDAGRAWRMQELIEKPTPSGTRVWVPVSERADCFGVLELDFGELGEDVRSLCEDVGVTLGHLLVTAHQYTDLYELLSRRRDMNLAAEMHWEIQPAMRYVGPGVAVAGWIEPAYEVGGDAFDYSINEGVLDFAILDAMGHGLEAALLSTQAVSAYR